MIRIIIDRFEGSFAVVELPDKKYVDMPRQLVPNTAKEGDIIKIEIDNEETSARKSEINKLTAKVWEK